MYYLAFRPSLCHFRILRFGEFMLTMTDFTISHLNYVGQSPTYKLSVMGERNIEQTGKAVAVHVI